MAINQVSRPIKLSCCHVLRALTRKKKAKKKKKLPSCAAHPCVAVETMRRALAAVGRTVSRCRANLSRGPTHGRMIRRLVRTEGVSARSRHFATRRRQKGPVRRPSRPDRYAAPPKWPEPPSVKPGPDGKIPDPPEYKILYSNRSPRKTALTQGYLGVQMLFAGWVLESSAHSAHPIYEIFPYPYFLGAALAFTTSALAARNYKDMVSHVVEVASHPTERMLRLTWHTFGGFTKSKHAYEKDIILPDEKSLTLNAEKALFRTPFARNIYHISRTVQFEDPVEIRRIFGPGAVSLAPVDDVQVKKHVDRSKAAESDPKN